MIKLKKNSPKMQLSQEDFIVPIKQLLWVLLGVVAAWLKTDLPASVDDGTFISYAIGGLAIYLSSLVYRLINDFSGTEVEDR